MSRTKKTVQTPLQRFESLLLSIIVLALSLLVVVQSLLVDANTRPYLSLTDRLEGFPITPWYPAETAMASGPEPRQASLKFTLVDLKAAPAAAVLINGRQVAFFISPEVWVRVMDGDVIELDTTAYQRELRFRLSEVPPHLLEPAPGWEIVSRGSIEYVGQVRFKK